MPKEIAADGEKSAMLLPKTEGRTEIQAAFRSANFSGYVAALASYKSGVPMFFVLRIGDCAYADQ